MLMQYGLDVAPLLQAAYNTFPQGKLAADTVDEVAEFMQARLAVLLQNDFAHDEVAAVLAKQPQNLGDINAKLSAVAAFKRLPEAAALAAANKRVHNILKKNELPLGDINPDLLQQLEEQDLYQATQGLVPQINQALAHKDFQAALSVLAAVKPTVDAFFDKVMVMADDEDIKRNRLALLQALSRQMNAVADIALLNE